MLYISSKHERGQRFQPMRGRARDTLMEKKKRWIPPDKKPLLEKKWIRIERKRSPRCPVEHFFFLTCFFHFLPSSAHLSLSFIYYTYNTVLSCWISSFFNYFFFFSSTICSHVQLQHPESSQEFAAAFFHRCPFSSFPFGKEEKREKPPQPARHTNDQRHVTATSD